MSATPRRALVALVASGVVIAVLLGLRQQVPVDAPARAAAATPALDRPLPASPLDRWRGRWVVTAPIALHCRETCPQVRGALRRLAALARAEGIDGDELVVAPLAIDPRPRAALWRALGVHVEVPEGPHPDIAHTDAAFVVDPRGHLRDVLPGVPPAAWTARTALVRLLRLMRRPAVVAEPAGDARAALRGWLAAQRGRPVVVNAWASWCGPCREELDVLADAAAARDGRVAFLGLDVQDEAGPARRLLAAHPTGYPSLGDPDGDALRSLVAARGLPVTVLLDAQGRVRKVHNGQYRDAAELAADLQGYGG